MKIIASLLLLLGACVPKSGLVSRPSVECREQEKVNQFGGEAFGNKNANPDYPAPDRIAN